MAGPPPVNAVPSLPMAARDPGPDDGDAVGVVYVRLATAGAESPLVEVRVPDSCAVRSAVWERREGLWVYPLELGLDDEPSALVRARMVPDSSPGPPLEPMERIRLARPAGDTTTQKEGGIRASVKHHFEKKDVAEDGELLAGAWATLATQLGARKAPTPPTAPGGPARWVVQHDLDELVAEAVEDTAAAERLYVLIAELHDAPGRHAALLRDVGGALALRQRRSLAVQTAGHRIDRPTVDRDVLALAVYWMAQAHALDPAIAPTAADMTILRAHCHHLRRDGGREAFDRTTKRAPLAGLVSWVGAAERSTFASWQALDFDMRRSDDELGLTVRGVPSVTARRVAPSEPVPATEVGPDSYDALDVPRFPLPGRPGPLDVESVAHELGVHPTPHGLVPTHGASRLSPFVPRPSTTALEDAVGRALTQDGPRIVVARGPSHSGKTRALVRALARAEADVGILAPRSAEEIRSAIGAIEDWTAPTIPVLWLDDADHPRFRTAGFEAEWLDAVDRIARTTTGVVLATAGGRGPYDVTEAERAALRWSNPAVDLAADPAVSIAVDLRHDDFADDGAQAKILRAYGEDAGRWQRLAAEGSFLSALGGARWLRERYDYGRSATRVSPAETSRAVAGQAVTWAALVWQQSGRTSGLDRDRIGALHQAAPFGPAGRCTTPRELVGALTWATRSMDDDPLACLLETDVDGIRAAPAAAAVLPPVTIDADTLELLDGLADGDGAQDGLVSLRHENGGNPFVLRLVVRTKPGPLRNQPGGTRGGGLRGAKDAAASHAFDFGAVGDAAWGRGRLSTHEGTVKLQLRTDDASGRFEHGVVAVLAGTIVVAEAPDGEDVSGHSFTVATTVPAPATVGGWEALADTLSLLPRDAPGTGAEAADGRAEPDDPRAEVAAARS